MALYLLITDNGINTRPVRADTGAELLAAFRAEAQGGSVKVAALELVVAADMAADGSVPQAFLTAQTNRADLVAKTTTALATNATFIALATPTNAQVLAQVQTVTKECSALIRLLLGQLDSTGGTGP